MQDVMSEKNDDLLIRTFRSPKTDDDTLGTILLSLAGTVYLPPGEDYDLVAIFDALHDMGDPVGASKHIANSLSDGGTFMLVEPFAGDSLEENIHPLGQIYYSFSTMICVPASRSQEVGLGLGAQAGQKRLTEVLNEGGFSQVRRAAETPTNMVLEARV